MTVGGRPDVKASSVSRRFVLSSSLYRKFREEEPPLSLPEP